MDGSILDVVLGLALIYLVLALLVSKLQEVIAGQMRSGRAKNLHDMVFEAVGRDAGLRDRVFTNSLIFALYESRDTASKSGSFSNLWTATGPSSLPPPLFARALLAELYNDGKHSSPRDRYTSPRAFVETESQKNSKLRIWGALRGLVAGCDGSWDGFETAIATWFADIGDRADGWYQRTAQNWSLFLAFVTAVALNVDTFNLTDRLSNEPVLRRAVATLAQQVNAVFPGGREATPAQATAAAAGATALAPALRADQALQTASALLTDAYFRDDQVSKFDPNRQSLVLDGNSEKLVKGCAAPTPPKGKSEEHLSNPSTWVKLLPPLRAFVKQQRLPPDSASPVASTPLPPGTLRDAYKCISNLIGWIGVAESASNVPAVKTNLRSAGASLDQAADALLEIIEDQGGNFSLTRLFRDDPDAFNECARQPGASRSSVRRCVAAQMAGQVSLPIGHTERNWRLAFCETKSEPTSDTPGRLCGDKSTFKRQPGLNIDPMVLVHKDIVSTLLLFLAGCGVTAFFVALGAPFWFDLLGRVVKLRAAGKRPPPEAITSVGGAAKAADAVAAKDDGGAPREPFSLARNVVEKQLLPSDIVDLQTHLGGLTPTGVLDGPTRAKLAERAAKEGLSSGEDVSLILYNRVVGAHPAYLIGQTVPQGQKVVSGETLAEAGRLSDSLEPALGFAGRIVRPVSQITPELRALMVLYRYKTEQANHAPHSCPLVAQARTLGQLDQFDAALIATMLALPAATQFKREPAPWLDWAIGELGQFEAADLANPSLPNPRVVEYLQSVEMTETNPIETSWCAAFVSWVLARHHGEPGAGGGFKSPPTKSLQAADFGGPGAKSWGTSIWPVPAAAVVPPVAPATWDTLGILPGDIVTLCDAPKPAATPAAATKVSHVAFVLEVDAGGLWALGGNQNKGKEVCVSRFPNNSDAVVEIRRPV